MSDQESRPIYTHPTVKVVLAVTSTVLLAIAIARLLLAAGGAA